MHKSWLQEVVTVEQIEAKHPGRKEPEAHIKDEKLRMRRFEDMRRVFGFMHANWLKFKNTVKDGDVIYHFKSPPETWRRMCGREGYVIVREDKMVTAICFCMN